MEAITAAATAAAAAVAQISDDISATFTAKEDAAGFRTALVHVRHRCGGKGDILIRCAYGYLYVDSGDKWTTRTIPRRVVDAAAEAVRKVAVDRGLRPAPKE